MTDALRASYGARDDEIRPLMRCGINYNPYEHAARLDIQILHRDITLANGYWLGGYGTIVLANGLASWAARSALAHEIGHAVHGHGDRGAGDPVEEWIADRYAATMLVTPEELQRALAAEVGTIRIARRLRITSHMLRAMCTPLAEPEMWDDPWATRVVPEPPVSTGVSTSEA